MLKAFSRKTEKSIALQEVTPAKEREIKNDIYGWARIGGEKG